MRKLLDLMHAQQEGVRKRLIETQKERMTTIKEKELVIEQEKTKIACYKERRKDLDSQIA